MSGFIDESARIADDIHNAYEEGYADGKRDAVVHARWILDEDPHDGDCRCSHCFIAIAQMDERNHGVLNALTGGKWWTYYKYCPQCGAKMDEPMQPNDSNTLDAL